MNDENIGIYSPPVYVATLYGVDYWFTGGMFGQWVPVFKTVNADYKMWIGATIYET